MALLRILAVAAALLALSDANAQSIAGAVYDPVRDQLVVDIIYQGTNPSHDFDLVWEMTSPTRNFAFAGASA